MFYVVFCRDCENKKKRPTFWDSSVASQPDWCLAFATAFADIFATAFAHAFTWAWS